MRHKTGDRAFWHMAGGIAFILSAFVCTGLMGWCIGFALLGYGGAEYSARFSRDT